MTFFSHSLKPCKALSIYDYRLIEILIHLFHLERPILEVVTWSMDTSTLTYAWAKPYIKPRPNEEPRFNEELGPNVEVGSNVKVGSGAKVRSMCIGF